MGVNRDVYSDAAVLKPILDSETGLAVSQAVNPTYSKIDAYHMTACTIDEAMRRVIAVGADPDQIGGVDNFCWPTVQYDPATNPDGKFKAAQLVRANRALRDMCLAYRVPLLSGKDSMYIDGFLEGAFGERHKVSGLETLQFTTSAVVPDVNKCVTMDFKSPGDIIYVVGLTRDELGGSEYYELFGYTGLNVPEVHPEAFFPVYGAVYEAIRQGLAASVHGVYRGGLAVHLALSAMGGATGADIDLSKVPVETPLSDARLAFSESPGRFIISVPEAFRERFEALFKDLPLAPVGTVKADSALNVRALDGSSWLKADVHELTTCWKKTFGDLI